MTPDEQMRWDLELEQIKAQTSLALKQAKTEFWKVGIATAAAGAVVGGLLVSIINW